jgi:hypothetical protein
MTKDPLQMLLDTTRIGLAASVAAGTAIIASSTPPSLAFVGAPITAILLLKGLERAVPALVARSNLVRRTVFGPAFVEGWWKDATYSPATSEVLMGSCSHWKYEDGHIEVNGQCFGPGGNFRGGYQLHSVGLPRRAMIYEFKWALTGPAGEDPPVHGYGRLNFCVAGGRPQLYYGSFLDDHNKRTLPFRGWFAAEDGSDHAPKTVEEGRQLAMSAMQLLREDLGKNGGLSIDSAFEAPGEEAAGTTVNP